MICRKSWDNPFVDFAIFNKIEKNITAKACFCPIQVPTLYFIANNDKAKYTIFF